MEVYTFLFGSKPKMAFSETMCVQACLAKIFGADNSYCEACADNPPLGLQMCATAGRYADNEYLGEIADKCATEMRLTDSMCIVACMNYDFPHFNRICMRCRRDPPMTGKMCRYACDHTSQLSIICNKCSHDPPASSELCGYACQDKISKFSVYYNRMCTVCKYRNY